MTCGCHEGRGWYNTYSRVEDLPDSRRKRIALSLGIKHYPFTKENEGDIAEVEWNEIMKRLKNK